MYQLSFLMICFGVPSCLMIVDGRYGQISGILYFWLLKPRIVICPMYVKSLERKAFIFLRPFLSISSCSCISNIAVGGGGGGACRAVDRPGLDAHIVIDSSIE